MAKNFLNKKSSRATKTTQGVLHKIYSIQKKKNICNSAPPPPPRSGFCGGGVTASQKRKLQAPNHGGGIRGNANDGDAAQKRG